MENIPISLIYEPSSFKEGMIVKMEPGCYTTQPYYVLIKEVTPTGITTTIPGKHDLVLDKITDRLTWEYQVSRMTIIGNQDTHGDLLLNQRLPEFKDFMSLVTLKESTHEGGRIDEHSVSENSICDLHEERAKEQANQA